jgi:hypothetical protein
LLLCYLSARGRTKGIYQSLTSFARPVARVFKIPAAHLARQWLLLRYYSLLFDLKNCGPRIRTTASCGFGEMNPNSGSGSEQHRAFSSPPSRRVDRAPKFAAEHAASICWESNPRAAIFFKHLPLASHFRSFPGRLQTGRA